MRAKLHFAVTGLTAPEIISKQVNPELPNMGPGVNYVGGRLSNCRRTPGSATIIAVRSQGVGDGWIAGRNAWGRRDDFLPPRPLLAFCHQISGQVR